ncbi:MarR family winged helix-turn-helix transcriptional regulator [Saccharopolyspora gloriosae]|uniref:MarR family winged helix-turn-helix transcriptional regulator n=1 Tax=Saccharopolyspora gloriosae TaxID=455344 RepID=UPI001FB6D875|nr:MarR family transcriptional regulator [Saccharopolyspora gloriosae]
MKRTPDLIDAARSQWSEVRPDINTSSMDVIGRVLRGAAVLRRRLDATIAEGGLNRAEFDLLCALRRGGAAMTPGRLNELTVSSGAATTKRLRELTERGLLERSTDQRDRRSARVRLTEQGERLVDELFPRVLEAEQALLSGLAARQRDSLAGGLADLLWALEGPGEGR